MFKGIKNRLNAMLQIGIEQEIQRVYQQMREKLADPLICYGGKVYSQCDEDGIIAEIFRRIGVKNHVCVEIGCGNGLENNTHYLILQGWRGIWVDGSPRNISALKKDVGLQQPHPDLAVIEGYATPDTVNGLMQQGLRHLVCEDVKDIDFFSIDIDGYDASVLEALDVIRPRVVCAEYNAKFPPALDIAVPFNPNHGWNGNDYMGASLATLVRILGVKGYDLVCCNVSAANAFFVLGEENQGRIPVAPIEVLYQPARYHLSYRKSGHDPSSAFLRDCLKARRTR